MTNTLPKSHRPENVGVEGFIGPAKDIAALFRDKLVPRYKEAKVPAFFLLWGEPGVAKTSLGKYAMKLFGVEGFNQVDYSGTDMTLERVQNFAQDLRMPSMFEGFRGYLFDEIDAMPRVAQVRFLKLCDDVADGRYQTRNGTVIVATCNSKLSELEKRFQSRFQSFEVQGPSKEETVKFLSNWIDPTQATSLVQGFIDGAAEQDGVHPSFVRMDVRCLLQDATTMMLMN